MTDEVAEAFAEIALRLHDEPDVEQTVESVLDYALVATGAGNAGVMFVHGGGRVESVAITDPVVEKADRMQMELGEGPCLSAIREHGTFRIADTLDEPRWPEWSSRIAQLGLRSVLGIQLHTVDTMVGALNLYAAEPGWFADPDDLAIAEIFARHASIALATARREAHLEAAMDARHRVGLAQGILMERHSLTDEQAFELLRRFSQEHHIKLNEVARQIIEDRNGSRHAD